MPTMTDDTSRKRGVQNFLKALTNMGDIAANETRLKTQLLANEYEKKQNFIYKIQEKLQEQEMQKKFLEQKNQMTQDMVANMRQEQGGDELGIGSPEVRAGAGGEANVYYPSARDKEFAIKQGWARVKAKQAKGMQLSPAEVKFTDMYPESMLGKKDEDLFSLNENVNIPEGYENERFDSKGNPVVKKKKEQDLKTVIETKILQGTATPEEISRYNVLRGKTVEEDIFPNKTGALPNGITEEAIQSTLKLHPEYTRETLLQKLGIK